MIQVYSDPEYESDSNALPNFEVWYVSQSEAPTFAVTWCDLDDKFNPADYVGWYYWACFPGCLPDSDPVGPFETEDAAIADLRED